MDLEKPLRFTNNIWVIKIHTYYHLSEHWCCHWILYKYSDFCFSLHSEGYLPGRSENQVTTISHDALRTVKLSIKLSPDQIVPMVLLDFPYDKLKGTIICLLWRGTVWALIRYHYSQVRGGWQHIKEKQQV